ncbi:papain-like cysteine protease family protein [Nonomuraea sp. NPDC049158]|uniref:papain-like cysteine protease family protein n=1 Tax=Nonomuraea sp. NPDC049158 TaxID=3155649 RepID=UPI0033C966CF
MPRNLLRAIPALVAAGLCLASSVTPASATSRTASTQHVLYITMQHQEKTSWCWAAAGATIAAYHGDYVSQNAFCNLAKDYPVTGVCPNDAGNPYRVQHALERRGFYWPGEVIENSISWTALKGQIDVERPFYAGISWAAGGGHALVVYGYDTADGGQVMFGNPAQTPPRYRIKPYSYFVGNDTYTWTRTLDNIVRTKWW